MISEWVGLDVLDRDRVRACGDPVRGRCDRAVNAPSWL